MTVADFMSLTSNHPEYGYYMSGDPLGRQGDFTTAPEISQVFGELIGLWVCVAWQQMDHPDPVHLVECGPGRGTLMQDLLRASNGVAGFRDAARLHLVETSSALRTVQQRALRGINAHWHDSIGTLPPGPMILIANEFLDALPVRQLVRVANGWVERRVATLGNSLVFLTPDCPDAGLAVPESIRSAPSGAIFETSPQRERIGCLIGRRLASEKGIALFSDYGHDRSATGETLQAVCRHRSVAPLSEAGKADLSAHVDFEAFGRQVEACGAAVHGPVTQRRFLRALGIEARTARLGKAAADRAQQIRRASKRLIDPGQMGTLFKVLVATSPDLAVPAGFEGC